MNLNSTTLPGFSVTAADAAVANTLSTAGTATTTFASLLEGLIPMDIPAATPAALQTLASESPAHDATAAVPSLAPPSLPALAEPPALLAPSANSAPLTAAGVEELPEAPARFLSMQQTAARIPPDARTTGPQWTHRTEPAAPDIAGVLPPTQGAGDVVPQGAGIAPGDPTQPEAGTEDKPAVQGDQPATTPGIMPPTALAPAPLIATQLQAILVPPSLSARTSAPASTISAALPDRAKTSPDGTPAQVASVSPSDVPLVPGVVVPPWIRTPAPIPAATSEDFRPRTTAPDEAAGLAEVIPGAVPAAAAPMRLEAMARMHHADMQSHPQHAGFPAELASEVRFLVGGGLQQAELRLNPPELGPIQIQLHIQAQTADISFAAAHSQTRESIEQALPALREMLAEQGVKLGEAGVSAGRDQGFGRPQPETAEPAPSRRTAGPGTDAGHTVILPPPATRAVRGMLDLYA